MVRGAIDKYPSLEKLYVDGGYSGTCAVHLKQEHQIDVQVVRHPANRNVGRWVNPEQGELFPVLADSKGFVVLPKRWVVERRHRRHCRPPSALSCASPTEPIDGRTLTSLQRIPNAIDLYCDP